MTITYIDHFSPSIRMASESERERASRSCTARCCCFPCPHRRALTDLALLIERYILFFYFIHFLSIGVLAVCGTAQPAPGQRGAALRPCAAVWRWTVAEMTVGYPAAGLHTLAWCPGGFPLGGAGCRGAHTGTRPPGHPLVWCLSRVFLESSRRTLVPLVATGPSVQRSLCVQLFMNLLMQVPSLLLPPSMLVSMTFFYMPPYYYYYDYYYYHLPLQYYSYGCPANTYILIVSGGERSSSFQARGGSGLARPAVGISRRFLYVLCKKEKVRLLRIVSVSPL